MYVPNNLTKQKGYSSIKDNSPHVIDDTGMYVSINHFFMHFIKIPDSNLSFLFQIDQKEEIKKSQL